MAPIIYFGTGIVMPTTIELVAIYGILVLINAYLAASLAYDGQTPYEFIPERYRNRHWVRPLLPLVFILLPAVLWPLVMAAVLLLVIANFIIDEIEGIWKNFRGERTGNDLRTGVRADTVLLNGLDSERTPLVTPDTSDAMTVSEPGPVYGTFKTTHEHPNRLVCWEAQ